MTSLNDLTDRLQRVEYALYKSENPETRFDNIYAQLQSLETGRKQDKQDAKNQREQIDAAFKDTFFKFESHLKEMQQYKEQFDG